jgi:hypothetical protein
MGYAIKTIEAMQVKFRQKQTFVHKYSREKQQALYLIADLLDELLKPMQEELAERLAVDLEMLRDKKV